MLYHFVNDDQYEDIFQFHKTKIIQSITNDGTLVANDNDTYTITINAAVTGDGTPTHGLSSKSATTVLVRLCGLSQGVQNSVYAQFPSFCVNKDDSDDIVVLKFETTEKEINYLQEIGIEIPVFYESNTNDSDEKDHKTSDTDNNDSNDEITAPPKKRRRIMQNENKNENDTVTTNNKNKSNNENDNSSSNLDNNPKLQTFRIVFKVDTSGVGDWKFESKMLNTKGAHGTEFLCRIALKQPRARKFKIVNFNEKNILEVTKVKTYYPDEVNSDDFKISDTKYIVCVDETQGDLS